MRLLLQYKTADTKHPHGDVHPDDLRNVLGGLGWLPTDDTCQLSQRRLLRRPPRQRGHHDRLRRRGGHLAGAVATPGYRHRGHVPSGVRTCALGIALVADSRHKRRDRREPAVVTAGYRWNGGPPSVRCGAGGG